MLDLEFKIRDLPSFGAVRKQDIDAMNSGYKHSQSSFERVVIPKPGDVACCFDIERNMRHVGVVVSDSGHLRVMHTGSKHGVVCTPISQFKRLSKATE